MEAVDEHNQSIKRFTVSLVVVLLLTMLLPVALGVSTIVQKEGVGISRDVCQIVASLLALLSALLFIRTSLEKGTQ